MAGKEEKYRAPALEKGLDIVELLSLNMDGMTQVEIAKALERSQGEIYRMLSTLVRRGYVVRRSEGDLYSLSLKMFAVSQRQPPIQRLLEVAAPKMRALTRVAWQACHIAMESDGDIVVVASVGSPGNWGLALRTGISIGLGNTGTGRVLAAFRTDAEVEELLDRHRLAEGEPPIDRTAFMEHVARVRERGFERMPSATLMGITNLAYPVLDQENRAVAVVNCPFLTRIDEVEVPDIDEVHELYQQFARELTDFYTGGQYAGPHG
ncbi:transcriptional regulator, IclR family protein [Oceanicola granulosus HTCC2516]|uniref:Transcriptional regulator, IclR family protein n=1 Tax=Oceanicola granulosus (strain ATCC BAA-861 / DSM 15982 / KCTC 12143 / HTCC2516) TaxID=314256 RepID=Q2CGU1_OCEGH|nr:IclR family transcriptional regulator [Oceanicola granulosus]EAR51844.1 transcriptional regulator, IclR family protein [Oceanicola granulosus HTCC2516]